MQGTVSDRCKLKILLSLWATSVHYYYSVQISGFWEQLSQNRNWNRISGTSISVSHYKSNIKAFLRTCHMADVCNRHQLLKPRCRAGQTSIVRTQPVRIVLPGQTHTPLLYHSGIRFTCLPECSAALIYVTSMSDLVAGAYDAVQRRATMRPLVCLKMTWIWESFCRSRPMPRT